MGGRDEGGQGATEPQELPRLIEQDPGAGAHGVDAGALASPSGRWALGLLREATPYRSPAGRKQRVQLALGYRRRRGLRWLLRPALVLGVLIGFGFGAFASAAIGGHWQGWVARAYRRWLPGTSPAPAVTTPRARLAARERAVGIESETAAALAAPPTASPAPLGMASRVRHSNPPGLAGDDGSAYVLEGMRALRVEGDPVRARAFLSEYLDRHPRGTLAEEALAISIEAALAHRDPDAPALGARYVAAYPGGAFGALARQAEARPGQ